MPKEFLGVHETAFPNSRSKALIENWFEERSVLNLDADRHSGTEVNVKRISKAHDGIVTVSEDAFDDLTVSLDTYRPQHFYTKEPTKTRAAALEKIFAEQAKKELKERKEKDKELVETELEGLRKANLIIKYKNLCPIAKTFKPEYVNEQPITYWTKRSRNNQGGYKGGDPTFKRDASFSTPIHLSYLTSAHPKSINM